VRLAAGDAHKAFQLVANNQRDLFEPFVSWMRLCYTYDFTKLTAEAAKFQEAQKEGQKYFLTYSLQMLRQIWIARLGIESLLQVQKEERQVTEKLGQTLDDEAIVQIQQWINQAHYHIDRNLNAKILFLNLSLKIAQVFQGIRQQKISGRA
jgi:DNA polymerase-3 subunit delta'